MKRILPLLSLFALLFLSQTALVLAAPQALITLNPGTPLWVSPNEPMPIQRAVQDLARDFQNVLGASSPITRDRKSLRGRVFVEVLGPKAGNEAQRDAKAAIRGRESHGVFVKRDGDGTRIVLQGADMRGTIYAIYTFSEKYLGVKPLWFWASQPPQT